MAVKEITCRAQHGCRADDGICCCLAALGIWTLLPTYMEALSHSPAAATGDGSRTHSRAARYSRKINLGVHFLTLETMMAMGALRPSDMEPLESLLLFSLILWSEEHENQNAQSWGGLETPI